ncbi:MAG: domain containing protein [Pedosphaera sp.]|nr:domain containing protein [Pedosphaera sp.]
MKRKPFRILLAVVVMAVVGVILWQVWLLRGASYGGKSLAAWVQRLAGGNNQSKAIGWGPMSDLKSGREAEAEQAIRAMGTNTLPLLLRTMHADNTVQSVKLEEFKRWVRSRVFRQPVGFGSEMSAIERRRWEAALVLHALGPMAKPAIPELALLVTNSVFSRDAAYALAGMGPEAMGPLRQAMTNSSDWVQLCAIWAVGQTPTNGQFAVSALLERLQDKTPMVRAGAAWSLGQIHADPELVAPALAAKLGDTGLNVRAMTEDALKEYGITNVTTAALVQYLDDPKLHIRMAATNALKAIDPEAAAKAGVR